MRHLADATPPQPVPLASLQPPLVSEVHPPSESVSVMSLKDLSTDLPLQYDAYHLPGYQHSVDVSGLTRLTAARKLGLAQIGVPPPCIAFMAEAGVSVDNVTDLPWTTLEGLVREVGGVGPGAGAAHPAATCEHCMRVCRLSWRRGRGGAASQALGRAHALARGLRSGRALISERCRAAAGDDVRSTAADGRGARWPGELLLWV